MAMISYFIFCTVIVSLTLFIVPKVTNIQDTPTLKCTELSIDYSDWQSCRLSAWDDCGMDYYKIDNFYYDMYYNGKINSTEYEMFKQVYDIISVCWIARADLCDTQYVEDIHRHGYYQEHGHY